MLVVAHGGHPKRCMVDTQRAQKQVQYPLEGDSYNAFPKGSHCLLHQKIYFVKAISSVMALMLLFSCMCICTSLH